MDNMGHMGNGYSNGIFGYSLDGFLSGLLALLFRLMIVVLVVAAIIAVVIWIKRTFFKNADMKFMQTFKNDPLLKTVAVVLIAVVGLMILFGVFGSFTNTGMGFGMNGYGMNGYGMNGYGMNGNGMNGYGMNGYNASQGIYGLLNLLVKVFAIVLVVSLVLALVAYLKKQFDAGVFNTKISGDGKDNAGNTPENSADNTNKT